MMNVCFTVLFLATLGSLPGGINADVDDCQPKNRIKCIFDIPIAASNCPGICNWCPSLRWFRRCQTSNRACLVSGRKKESAYTDRATCEAEGLVWCGGRRTQECVHSEPVLKLCFKLNDVDPCPNTHTTEFSCNTDTAGCFWCVEGRPERLSPRCWKLPVDCSGNSCCKQAPCRRMFDVASCQAKGCNYCVEDGQEYCNFGPPGPLPTPATTAIETTTATTAKTTAAAATTATTAATTAATTTVTAAATTASTTTPETTAEATTTAETTAATTAATATATAAATTAKTASTCPTGSNVENCFKGLSVTPTEELCVNMSCIWCSEGGTDVCKRNTYAATCMASPQHLCPVSGLDSQLACKSWGCEWCGGGSSFAECQRSTSCTSCSCPSPQACSGTSAKACGLLGCLWCDVETTAGHCINMNSEGITPGTANNFTDCTRTCGGGTQWRFSDCGHPNPCSCPREYRTCNSIECPTEICSQGVRPRYHDSTTCCQNHTFACGRNPLNENRLPPAVRRRKKRVVSGMPTGSVQRWPWLDVVYFNLSSNASYCPATLIGEKWLITAADCVRDMDAADSLVHLDVYDRSQAPGKKANVQQFHIYSNFGIVELTAPVTPYSHYVHPLCMPNGEIAHEDRKCVVAGWGLTNASDSSSCSSIPHDVTVRVMDWGLCEQAWGHVGGLDPSVHFCAGIPEGGKDFCIKDRGAPLMCQRCENCAWYLAGIATPYTFCGEPLKPGLYYRVDVAVQTWMTTGQAINLPSDSDTYTSCPP